ncbi:MAG TPA: DUF559 domain-containing protein [Bacteroidota bacterium]
MIPYNRKLKNTSRTLRKNMTVAERLLWSKIRRKQLKGLQFYRQKTVGNYIVDFYCPAAKIIIEVDGSQHFEEQGKKKDHIRDEYLSRLGFEVLRFPNWEVMNNLDEIVEEIDSHLPTTESPSFPL